MRFPFMLSVLLGCLFFSLPTSPAICDNGLFDHSSSSPAQATATDSEALNANGVRNDIQAYIDSAYPNSAKRRKALESYAQKLQYAITKVTTEAEAENVEQQIIRSMLCISKLGEEPDAESPTRTVKWKTIDTPGGLEAHLRFGTLIAGKVFVVSCPEDTIETVCDFDPHSLPD